MGIRQQLNRNPAIGTVAALVLLLGAAASLWLTLKAPSEDVGEAFSIVLLRCVRHKTYYCLRNDLCR